MRVSLAGRARADFRHEGVVIAIVGQGVSILEEGYFAHPVRSTADRYVVECGTCERSRQVVRFVFQMEVVWP